MQEEYQKMFNNCLEEVKQRLDTQTPITYEGLIANAIFTSKKLTILIEELENLILQKQNIKYQNELLILTARLEMVIQEIKNIKQSFVEK